MNPSRPTLLLHPQFLISLLLLVLNDCFFKYEYHNWVTGKLSDITGIFVLAIFLFSFFPARKTVLCFLIALFFIYWKLPLSQPFIDWCNYTLFLPVARVIDYSDIAALLMLYPAYRLKPVQYRPALWLKAPVTLISIFAIMATSAPYRPFYFRPTGYVSIEEAFKTKHTQAQILHKLDSLQIVYRLDSIEYLPAISYNYFLRYQPAGDTVHWVSLNDLKDTAVLYRKTSYPFYVIPSLPLEKDTLSNIQFRIHEEKKKTTIELKAVTVPEGMHYDYYTSNPVMKKYKNMLKAILGD